MPANQHIKTISKPLFKSLLTHCPLPLAYCLLPITHCLLLIAHCLLLIAHCLLLIAHCLLPIAYCLLPIVSLAQSSQTITYTVKDGLPSNALYRTIIDKKGFLWIATEIGLSRFDGKKFRNYTTSDGLSDNEITDLFADSSGTVWVIPFRRTPCYYNPVTNRFESEETDKELSKIIMGTPSWPHILKYGGVAFSNNKREVFVYRNGKATLLLNGYKQKFSPIVAVIEYKPNNFLFFAQDSIWRFARGKLTAVMPVNKIIRMSESFGSKVYMATSNAILTYSFTPTGDIQLVAEKKYPFEIRIFCKTGKRFAVTSINGTTYMLNKNTLELSEIISAIEGVPVRNVLEDKDDNIWLATLDMGLVKVQQKRISSLDNLALRQSFNALIKTKNIFAGNNKGEVYKYDGLYVKKLQLNKDKNIDTWVRKIINTKYGIYVASQSASFLINEKKMTVEKAFRGTENRSNKTACLLNDSVMLLGNHGFAYQYNLKTKTVIDSIGKRVVSMGCDLLGNIYIGSNEGLYNWQKSGLKNMAEKRKSFSYKINAMACSPDNWCGLAWAPIR
jgi:ligand-binding sensor domain-containing protein